MRVRIPNRHLLRLTAALLAAGAVITLLLILLHRWEMGQETAYLPSSGESVSSGTASSAADAEQTYYKGSWYTKKEHLETVLLIGVDKFEEDQYLDGYYNTQQADFLLLLILDHGRQSASVLQINRDTMTDITILGINGKKAGSMTGQLALAHTYGSGKEDSCLNTAEAVSGLLYGAPVNHYISLTMDAVQLLNDLVGGVTVTVLDDFSAVDASLVQGQEITLRGAQTLTYVRTRGGLEDSSNLSRMARQRQYLAALRETYAAASAQNPELLPSAVLQVSPYMVSDCTADQLLKLYDQLEWYAASDMLTLEGEAVQENGVMAFYPDEEALRETVVELFYDPQNPA